MGGKPEASQCPAKTSGLLRTGASGLRPQVGASHLLQLSMTTVLNNTQRRLLTRLLWAAPYSTVVAVHELHHLVSLWRAGFVHCDPWGLVMLTSLGEREAFGCW